MRRKRRNPALLMPVLPERMSMRQIEQDGQEMLDEMDDLPPDFEDDDGVFQPLFDDVGDR